MQEKKKCGAACGLFRNKPCISLFGGEEIEVIPRKRLVAFGVEMVAVEIVLCGVIFGESGEVKLAKHRDVVVRADGVLRQNVIVEFRAEAIDGGTFFIVAAGGGEEFQRVEDVYLGLGVEGTEALDAVVEAAALARKGIGGVAIGGTVTLHCANGVITCVVVGAAPENVDVGLRVGVVIDLLRYAVVGSESV